MAQGDFHQEFSSSIADDGTWDIKPATAVKVHAHNIFFPQGSQVELYWTDGSNTILWRTTTEPLSGYVFELTQTDYLVLKNISGAAIYAAWTGVE